MDLDHNLHEGAGTIFAGRVQQMKGPSAEPSDVLGRASSPEPTEPSPFKPKPGLALTRARSGLGPGFRFRKPKPGAQARASMPCGLV
jgi:hypothetical protein